MPYPFPGFRSLRCFLERGFMLLLLGLPSMAWAQTAHFSGFQTTLGPGVIVPVAVAVDGNGNVYVASVEQNDVIKFSCSAGTFTQTSSGAGSRTPVGATARLS